MESPRATVVDVDEAKGKADPEDDGVTISPAEAVANGTDGLLHDDTATAGGNRAGDGTGIDAGAAGNPLFQEKIEEYDVLGRLFDIIIYLTGTVCYLVYIFLYVFSGTSSPIIRQTVAPSSWVTSSTDSFIMEHYIVAENFTCSGTFSLWGYCQNYGGNLGVGLLDTPDYRQYYSNTNGYGYAHCTDLVDCVT